MADVRPPVLLADGPHLRASAVRPLLDAAGLFSRPYRGEDSGPALILVDPQRSDAAALLAQAPTEAQLRAVKLPSDSRLLVPALEAAALGLGQPEAAVLSQLAAVASELAGAANLDALLKQVAQRAQQLVEAEAGTVFLVDPDTGELVVRVAEGGAGAQMLDVRMPGNKGLVGWVVQSRLPVMVNSPRADLRFDSSHDDRTGFVTRNLAAVPIYWRGEIVGVVEVVNKRGGPFGDADLRALAALAPHVGIAINHTRSAEALRRISAQARQRTTDLESLVQQRTAVLARAKKEWEQTFDAISEPLAVLEGFTIRRANRAYARRARLPIADVVGKHCYALLGRKSPCPGCPLAATPPHSSGELQMRDGQRAVLTSFVLQDGATVVHYRDVTAERELEAKLRDADRLAAVGQLAAGAAHEINNPIGFLGSNLVSLQSYFEELAEAAGRAELAAELAASGKSKEALALLARARGSVPVGELAEDATGLIAESQSGLKRVADIVKALKALAKQELSTGAAAVALTTSLELAVRQLSAEHPRVKVAWLSRDPVPVCGNPLQLQQALQAVLKNALQAAEAGGRSVSLSVERIGEEARATIADDGPGIPPHQLARVFEPFFTTRGIGGGVGLGLTAAYGIVTRHGGRIELLPREGGGTSAVISLPRLAEVPLGDDLALAAAV